MLKKVGTSVLVVPTYPQPVEGMAKHFQVLPFSDGLIVDFSSLC